MITREREMENVKFKIRSPTTSLQYTKQKKADVSHQLFNYLKFLLLPSPSAGALAQEALPITQPQSKIIRRLVQCILKHALRCIRSIEFYRS